MPSKPRNNKLPLAPSSRPAPPAAGPPAAGPPAAGPHAAPLRAGLPADYGAVLKDIRSRIRTAQTRAVLSVNRELIRLYGKSAG